VLLHRNLAANLLTDDVTVVEKAVADSPGVTRFSVFPGAQGNQLAIRGGEQSSGSIEVEVTSLDTYFGEPGWPRVDLI
jgi:FkbM family methyltransferase